MDVVIFLMFLFNYYYNKPLGAHCCWLIFVKVHLSWNSHQVAWAMEMTHCLYVGSCICLLTDLAVIVCQEHLFSVACLGRREQSPLLHSAVAVLLLLTQPCFLTVTQWLQALLTLFFGARQGNKLFSSCFHVFWNSRYFTHSMGRGWKGPLGIL